MQERRKAWKRIVIFGLTATIAIGIVSLTIGREIYKGAQPGLLSFGITHFAGYLFFLLMPVELAFGFYVTEHSPLILTLLAVATALLAQLIDYALGFLVSENVINDWIGPKRYERAKTSIDKYGNAAIFTFNLLPLSSPIIVLAAGMFNHKLRDVMLYSLLGLAIKYTVLGVLATVFS